MDETLSRKRPQSLTDDELIALLRAEQCELFIGRAGKLSLRIAPSQPDLSLPAPLIREAFRRRAQLAPFARVNGIRLRCTGKMSVAA